MPVLMLAQKKAVTETGDEVLLYDDGTWKYISNAVSDKVEIVTNPQAFKKSSAAGFLLKSGKFNIGVWLDAKKWSFGKANNNEEAEYEMQLKGKDLYAMLITEKIEIPLETLKTIAIENGRKAAPDLQVIKQEYRTVNNMKVLLLQMNGSTKGIKFSYLGYYFSSANGTVQFVTYTAQNLLSSLREDAEQLLNGLVTIE
ncbi:MAG: hypothetical protein SFU87_11015 [Chitinophagaceae bacterium]|nr:hypothetical protein [Chitinophagaceae bacterium]